MKNYAVIEIKGKQYLVSKGDEILIDKTNEKELVPRVLLLVKGDQVSVGKPDLSNVKIKFKVLGEKKGKKIEILKYKAKSRYRRKKGFRPTYTRLMIEDISK